ncbi:tetratricopeptide repeat protein [Pelagicoccus albus]|uniref:Tetratricopeptide repeat protein n=1 Tax=Pelagicoccus albus TaxID=415222 RepID=A0A7X1B9K6_9BACT|nr:tetratricopeptide repeat protein [Pelagicoccus albus]MBC2606928.1 tetratricopeptide repeat protein [Pelagicoccus albus]
MVNTKLALLLENHSVHQGWIDKFQQSGPSRSDEISKLETAVLHAYKNDPSLRNGLSRLAFYLLYKGQRQEALRLFAEDAKGGRQTWLLKLRYAECLGAEGNADHALSIVRQAYQESEQARDGRARCAWRLFWPTGNCLELIQWIKEDDEEGRLSADWRLKLAQVQSSLGNKETAETEVQKAYLENPSLTDGYANCAWELFKKTGETETPIKWMEHDRKTKRITSDPLLNLAELYATVGNLSTADQLVEQAYNSSPKLRDGYSRCYWRAFWGQGRYQECIIGLARDVEENRISLPWLLNLAEAHARAGDIEQAKLQVKRAYQADPTLKDGFTKSAWIYYHPRGEFEDLALLCGQDFETGRTSPAKALDYATALLLAGEQEKAYSIVENSYLRDDSLKDWFTSLADHALTYHPTLVTSLYEKDYERSRISQRGLKRFINHLVTTEQKNYVFNLADKIADEVDFDPYAEIAISSYALEGKLPHSIGAKLLKKTKSAEYEFLQNMIAFAANKPLSSNKSNDHQDEAFFRAFQKQLDCSFAKPQ